MAQRGLPSALGVTTWICRQCRSSSKIPRHNLHLRREFRTSSRLQQEVDIQAAPEIDLAANLKDLPARILPASPSYFTASPVFDDNLLLLQGLVEKHKAVPTVPLEQVPRVRFMRLSQYRSSTGERIAAAKYAKVLQHLGRLNRINPKLRHLEIDRVLKKFQRPGAAEIETAKPGKIDQYGRSVGVGRRKESSARVYLVEGTGEVLINGKSLVSVFSRLHDRESALWPLKITSRINNYNVFALVEGGGVTGQAESITLALARALLVHEPALKPALRRAGCVTFDARRVERKKPGRLKARKMPTWVKR